MSVNVSSVYDEIIVLGMGSLPIGVHNIFMQAGIHPKLIEYGPKSDYFNYLCAKKSIEYENFSRGKLTELLSSVTVPTLIVSAVNKYIFPGEVLSNPNIVAINYHNSILPNHKGSHAEAFSIFDMDEYTGTTWHWVSREIDNGDILASSKIKISRNDTSISLLSKQNKEALELLRVFLPDLLNGKNIGVKQASSKGTFHLSKDVPGGGILDVEWPIDKMYAFLRAFDYGELEILGRPQFIHEYNRYTWRSYSLRREKRNDSGVLFNTNERIIEIHKSSPYYISLYGVDHVAKN